MKYLFGLTGTVLSIFSSIFAQDFVELSGSLPERLSSERPYLVVADIYVSPGSSVTIEAGSVFLFEGFTGLHVQGTLYVKGETDKPVVFTSKNDRQWNESSSIDAAPYDWNGIDIYETAIGTDFTQCVVRYSVYGIKSQTEHFKINNSLFSSNGKADVTIKGEKLEVQANKAFSYGLVAAPEVKIPEPDQLAEVSSDTMNKQVKLVSEKPENRSQVRIRVLRYTSLAAALASGTATAWYYKTRYKSADQKLKDLSVLDEIEMQVYTSRDWESAKSDRNRVMVRCVSGACGAVIALGGFALSFAF